MKYNNLIGRKFWCDTFNYWYTDWKPREIVATGRGSCSPNSTPFKVAKHQICEEDCPFKGIECIYEQYNDNSYFIYPVSELERTKQLTEQDILNTQIYEIY